MKYDVKSVTGAWHPTKNPRTIVTVWGPRDTGLPVFPNDHNGPVVPDTYSADYINNMHRHMVAAIGYNGTATFSNDFFPIPGVPVLILDSPIPGIGHITITVKARG